MIEICLVVILTVSGGSCLNPVQSYSSLKVWIRQIWRSGAAGLKPRIMSWNLNRFSTIFPGAHLNYRAHSKALNFLGVATGCSVIAGLVPGFIINFAGNHSEKRGLGQSPGRRTAIYCLAAFISILGAGELMLAAQRDKKEATYASFFIFQSYRSMLTGVASQESWKWNWN